MSNSGGVRHLAPPKGRHRMGERRNVDVGPATGIGRDGEGRVVRAARLIVPAQHPLARQPSRANVGDHRMSRLLSAVDCVPARLRGAHTASSFCAGSQLGQDLAQEHRRDGRFLGRRPAGAGGPARASLELMWLGLDPASRRRRRGRRTPRGGLRVKRRCRSRQRRLPSRRRTGMLKLPAVNQVYCGEL